MKNLEKGLTGNENKIDFLKTLMQQKREELEEKVEAFNKPDKYINKTQDNSEAELVTLEEEIRELERKIKTLESEEKEVNSAEEEPGKEPEKESLKGLLDRITTEDKEAKAKIEKREGTDKEQAGRLEYQMKVDAEYYKILRESTEKIAAATTIDELCATLSKMEGLQGSQDYFPSELLIQIIKDIDYRDPSELSTFDQLIYVTRTAGLRFKVSELLSNKLQQKIEAAKPEDVAEMAKKEDENWENIPNKSKTVEAETEKGVKFEDLSLGQQAYVADKVENIKLSRTKELADRKFDEDTKNSGFFKKVVLGTFKRFNVAKTEKEIANNVEVTEEELQEIYKLASGMKVETQLGGRYRIDFFDKLKTTDGNLDDKKEDKWNTELTKWSRIPKEWEFDSASPSEKKQFAEAKEQYEKTRSEILNSLSTTLGGGEAALKHFALIESQLELNKFMSENPDAVSAMNDIKKQNTFGRALKDIAADLKTERGLYVALGFGTRFAVGVFGIVAAPLVAGPIGAMSARFRAKEALKIDSKKTRRNYSEHVVDKNSEGADVLSSKLELLITNYKSNEGNPEKQAAILDKIKTRLDYTQDKLEGDLVNYGDTNKRLENQFKLMKLISEAQVTTLQQEKYNDYWKGKETEERLDKLMSGLSDKFDAKKKKYIRDKMIRGGIFAAGVATLGALIAHWYQGDGSGAVKKGVDVVSSTPKPKVSEVVNTEDADKLTAEAMAAGERLKEGYAALMANQESAIKPETFTNVIDDTVARASGRVKYDSVWHSIWEIASQNKKQLGLPENATNDQVNAFVHKIWLNSPAKGRDIVQNGDKVFLKIAEDGKIVTGLLRKGK